MSLGIGIGILEVPTYYLSPIQAFITEAKLIIV